MEKKNNLQDINWQILLAQTQRLTSGATVYLSTNDVESMKSRLRTIRGNVKQLLEDLGEAE